MKTKLEIRYEWNPYIDRYVYRLYKLKPLSFWRVRQTPLDCYSTKQAALEALHEVVKRSTPTDTIGVVHSEEI